MEIQRVFALAFCSFRQDLPHSGSPGGYPGQNPGYPGPHTGFRQRVLFFQKLSHLGRFPENPGVISAQMIHDGTMILFKGTSFPFSIWKCCTVSDPQAAVCRQGQLMDAGTFFTLLKGCPVHQAGALSMSKKGLFLFMERMTVCDGRHFPPWFRIKSLHHYGTGDSCPRKSHPTPQPFLR